MASTPFPKIGLALGGGGARGLAHIPMLETFDDHGIRPHHVSGTSIGAVIASLYCGGYTGRAIQEIVDNLVITKGDSFRDIIRKNHAMKVFEFFDLELGRGGLFKGDHFIEYLLDRIGADTFEELQIPLTIVATDYWTAEQVVFDSGDLASAIKASMGLPGIFTPVIRDNRVLIDGAGCNPVPHDLLVEACDLVVAVDVMGYHAPEKEKERIPNLVNSVLGVFDIMQENLIALKAKLSPPDYLVKPDLWNIDLLDFYKANTIYDQAEPARQDLEAWLERLDG